MSLMMIFLSGAVMMATAGIAVFFLKFWKKSGDPLFLHFSIAFALLSIERWMLVVVDPSHETRYYVYVFRLAAFVLIAKAIFDKNMRDV